VCFWDNNGNLLNGGVRSYEYDHANCLMSVTSGTLTTGYTYPSTLLRTGDSLYRLITATYSSGEYYHYTYDPVGNRQSLTTHEDVVNYQYDDANRLTSVNGQTYNWDDNGNLLSDGTHTYTYDHANRLTQVVSGTLTTGFTYNGAGDRVAKTVDGVTTAYVLDPAAGLTQVLQETTDGQTTSYLYGHDLLAQYDSGTWAYHVDDGLGSVRQLADRAGQVVQGYSFSPFGVPLGESGGEPYGFTGEQWDASAGLVFLRARYMQPSTGRFINKDPFAGLMHLPQTLNGFSYAVNNPVNLSDPSGYLSNAAIAKGFEVGSFEEVLAIFRENERWGFLKLLQDAVLGDVISAGTEGRPYRMLDEDMHLHEIPKELHCVGDRVKISELSLRDYLGFLDRGGGELGAISWRSWDFNWYFVNGGGPIQAPGAPSGWQGGYTDWLSYLKSNLPDYRAISVSYGEGPINVGVNFAWDRYGNKYIAISPPFFNASVGSAFDFFYWEGYVGVLDPYHAYPEILRDPISEKELVDIMTGLDFTVEGHGFAWGLGGSISEKKRESQEWLVA
jgi:RHS repeat-associated protein